MHLVLVHPTNTDFNIDFANGTFKGRGFQFRTTLETTDPAQNMSSTTIRLYSRNYLQELNNLML